MASTRDLVKRRRAVQNIRRITRTMELIATARFKKAMDRATAAAAYTRILAELAADLSRSAGDVSHPLLINRPQIKNTLLLVICSNRGLCGGYNAGIIREATAYVKRIQTQNIGLTLDLSGKRAIAYYRFYFGRPPSGKTYTQFEDKPTSEQVDDVARRMIDEFVSGRVDRVDVAYMKFFNAGKQTPVVETLLPLAAIGATPAASSSANVDYLYLPDAADILTEVLPAAFHNKLFKCFLDAAVSEQIARRVAMKAATEAAGDMIKSISMKYNRARQAQITKEIAEVIGGAAALE